MDHSFKNFKIKILDTNQDELFFELIDNNRARLEDFFAGTVAKTMTINDTKDYCEVIANKIIDKSYFPYIISNLQDQFIGLVDVKNIDWNVPKAEIGYFIDAHYEGKGVVTKAVGHIIEYLIDTHQFKKLLCRAGSKNEGSIQVALKNGFGLEGTIRNDYRTTKGEIVDLNYYGRVFE